MVRAIFVTVLVIATSPVCWAAEGGGDVEVRKEKIRETVGRAVGYLQRESSAWMAQRKCAACHHMGMPVWAVAEAGRRGYPVDREFVRGAVEASIGSHEKMISAGLWPNPATPPDPRPMAKGVKTGTVFIAVAAESAGALTEGQKRSLGEIFDDAVKRQRADGAWDFYLSRPPINENQATDVAWVVMALEGEKAATGGETHRAALERAAKWLADCDAKGNPQVKRLKLLVAMRAGQSRQKLRAGMEEILGAQDADGGWAQLEGGKSDAFATGQALYVLALGGYGMEDARVRRGVEYLLERQRADGSWAMASRASPDGRPGSAKLLSPIQCGAAAWATLALCELGGKGSG